MPATPIAGSYEYFVLPLNGQDFFIDPENGINFNEDESRDIMINRNGLPKVTANKRGATFTLEGLDESQGALLSRLKENVMRAILGGSYTYEDLIFGSFTLAKTFVKNVTPAPVFSSYGLKIHRPIEVAVGSSVFT